MAWFLGDALLASAFRHCDRPALWADDEHLTYRQLFEQAARIAEGLAGAGIPTGSRVAILSRRSTTPYASIIGILLAGCTYVPLNPRFPPERNRLILGASEAVAVILDAQCVGALDTYLGAIPETVIAFAPESDARPVHKGKALTHSDLPSPKLEAIRTRPVTDPDQPAYVLFTSGTTGTPKGVPISHSNVGHYMEGIRPIAPLGPEDRVLQLVDLTFDLSVHDMFLTWLSGAQLYIMPENGSILVARFVREHGITACMLVPSTAAQARDRGLLKADSMQSLRHTLFLGEALPSEVARAWAKAAPLSKVFNTYGPTECTILVSSFEFHADMQVEVPVLPIGHPLSSATMGVFDPSHRPLPPGEAGELYLGGPQMTRGYWRAPHLDADRFVVVDGERWYRSGDIGQFDPQVGFLFSGRADRQVKINGYRVELQEIEGAIRRVCDREQVAVVAWPVMSESNATGTVAFIAGDELNVEDILGRAAKQLPPYMVPARIFFVEHLPLNANGKVDYKALLQDNRLGISS